MAPQKDRQKYDIVISYEECDLELVKYLTEHLKKAGLTVWYVDRRSGASQDVGQAIVDAGIFIVVLSVAAIQHDNLRDELALAYISNSSIFPVAKKYYGKIAGLLDSGTKLILSKINWSFFVKEEDYAENIDAFLPSIKQEIARQDAERARLASTSAEQDTDVQEVYDALNNHAPDVIRPNSVDQEPGQEDVCEEHASVLNSDFWERNFTGKKQTTWVEFKRAFLDDYGQRIIEEFDEEKQKFFLNVLYKDVFELYKDIDKKVYSRFVGKNNMADPHIFYERLKDYVIGAFAMREVFNMESTVRLSAIQNLASYQTPGVITLLFDLVDEDDSNVRAIAALALAKTGRKARKIEETLIKLLQDEDRVVRESACLSLAHIKCNRATSAIVDVWRNDAIKHVREAAEIALHRIGGQDAVEAIKVTQVLSTEMANLRTGQKPQ